MKSDQQPYTLAEVQTSFASKAAYYVGRRYRTWGVTAEDAYQEMMLWLYGPGMEKVERYLANSPQQSTRIYRSLLDAGITYGEKEKAARVGYEADDITWFTPRMIEALMPLVLDPSYDGKGDEKRAYGGHGRKATHEMGDLMTCVLDVRRALAKSPAWVGEVFELSAPGGLGWDDAVATVINYLGGDRLRGRRRVMSNAAAMSLTNHQEDE